MKPIRRFFCLLTACCLLGGATAGALTAQEIFERVGPATSDVDIVLDADYPGDVPAAATRYSISNDKGILVRIDGRGHTLGDMMLDVGHYEMTGCTLAAADRPGVYLSSDQGVARLVLDTSAILRANADPVESPWTPLSISAYNDLYLENNAQSEPVEAVRFGFLHPENPGRIYLSGTSPAVYSFYRNGAEDYPLGESGLPALFEIAPGLRVENLQVAERPAVGDIPACQAVTFSLAAE